MIVAERGGSIFLVKHLISPILIIERDERWAGKDGGEREVGKGRREEKKKKTKRRTQEGDGCTVRASSQSLTR